MIKELLTALHADENILCFNEDSGNIVYYCNDMGNLNIDFNNINLDNNLDKDDLDTVTHIRLLTWFRLNFEKHWALEKKVSEKLVLKVWYWWWNFCNSVDETKKIERIFTEELCKCVSVVGNMEVQGYLLQIFLNKDLI